MEQLELRSNSQCATALTQSVSPYIVGVEGPLTYCAAYPHCSEGTNKLQVTVRTQHANMIIDQGEVWFTSVAVPHPTLWTVT